MTNLLDETLQELAIRGLTPSDVRWVGSRDGSYATNWDTFTTIGDVEYDDGFGAQEIAYDLVVVGEGWWLERHEYDGAENWSYASAPVRLPEAKLLRIAKYGMWNSVDDAHMGPA